MHDIDDMRNTRLVATHGPLVTAREDEAESDLGRALDVLSTYCSYLDARHDVIVDVETRENL